MGYSPRGHKESDTTERLHFTYFKWRGTNWDVNILQNILIRQNHLNSSHFCSPYIGSIGIGLLTIFTIFSDRFPLITSTALVLGQIPSPFLGLLHSPNWFHYFCSYSCRLDMYPGSAFSNKNQFMSIICSNPRPPHSFPCYLEKNHKVLAMFSKDSWDLASLSVTIPWCPPIFLFHCSLTGLPVPSGTHLHNYLR